MLIGCPGTSLFSWDGLAGVFGAQADVVHAAAAADGDRASAVDFVVADAEVAAGVVVALRPVTGWWAVAEIR